MSRQKDARRAMLVAKRVSPVEVLQRLAMSQPTDTVDSALDVARMRMGRSGFAAGGSPIALPGGGTFQTFSPMAFAPAQIGNVAQGGADTWAPASGFPVYAPPPVTGTTTPNSGAAAIGDAMRAARQAQMNTPRWQRNMQPGTAPLNTPDTTAASINPSNDQGGGPSQGLGQSTSTGSYAGSIGSGAPVGPNDMGMAPGIVGMGYGMATGQQMSPGYAAASAIGALSGPAGMAAGLLGMGLNAAGFRGSLDPHALSGNADSANDKGADKAGYDGTLGEPGTKEGDSEAAGFGGVDNGMGMAGMGTTGTGNDPGGMYGGDMAGDTGGGSADAGGGAEADGGGGSDSGGGGSNSGDSSGAGAGSLARGGAAGDGVPHPASLIPGIHVQEHRAKRADGGEIPEDVPGIIGYHGTPHDFPAERLIQHPEGRLEHIVGAPAALPEPPQGARVLREFPHGRFRDDKIGTGEGAQAYGHGHYLAQLQEIAEAYKNSIARNPDQLREIAEEHGLSGDAAEMLAHQASMGFGGKRFDDWLDGLRESREDPLLPPRTKTAINQIVDKSVEASDAYRKMKSPGKLLQVRIRAHPEHFLDWDLPLAGQHPEVLSKIRAMNPRIPGMAQGQRLLEEVHQATKNPTGAALWRYLDNEAAKNMKPAQAASTALRAAGIPGIRYLDQGSRGKGDGTRNYVVFDPDLIDIQKKYAEGGEAMKRGGRLLQDQYPTHYLPHVGRQVMADGGDVEEPFDPANIFKLASGGAIDRALQLAHTAAKKTRHVPPR